MAHNVWLWEGEARRFGMSQYSVCRVCIWKATTLPGLPESARARHYCKYTTASLHYSKLTTLSKMVLLNLDGVAANEHQPNDNGTVRATVKS